MVGMGGVSNARNNRNYDYEAKGFSGMVSGMDTESIVKKMTANIQKKIDRVKMDKQKTEWKQEAYREVIESLIGFQNKYFSYANPDTNLLSTGLYNCVTKVPQGASSKAIEVTNSSSTDVPYDITSIKTLASQATYFGENAMAKNDIDTGKLNFGKMDVNVVENKTITVTYNNKEYELKLPGNMPVEKNAKNKQAEQMADYLNNALRKVAVSGTSHNLGEKLKFTHNEGKLSLEAKSSSDTNVFQLNKNKNSSETETLKNLGFKNFEGKIGKGGTKIEASDKTDVVKEQPLDLTDRTMDFTMNGTTKTIKFTKADSDKILQETNDKATKLAEVLQKKLDEKFGENKVKVEKKGDGLTFKVTDTSSTFKISSTNAGIMGSKGMMALENNATNRLDMTKTLSDLGIKSTNATQNEKNPYKKVYEMEVNGKKFTFTGRDTIKSVLSRINSDKEADVDIQYLENANKFSMRSDSSGKMAKLNISDGENGSELAKRLFGDTFTNKNKTEQEKGIKAGTDLEMTVKYKGSDTESTITRETNAVKLDGLDFVAKETFGWKEKQGTTTGELERDKTVAPVTFKNVTNTDKAVKLIKDMASDYNKILDHINKLVTTKREKKFHPLTDAQKRELTKEEIEKWEAKAKKGVVFADSNLIELASAMRFMFATAVGNMGFSSDIGIRTANHYSGNGKISVDEKKLKEVLTTDPERVKNMFTATASQAPGNSYGKYSGGFATRIKSLFENYAKETGANKGILVERAGLKNNPLTRSSSMMRKQREYDRKIEALQKLMKTRRKKYQARFSKLEVYMAKMMSQSAWLQSSGQ